METISLKISALEIQAIRRLNARINGFFGGHTKSTKRAAASRKNAKKALKARLAAA